MEETMIDQLLTVIRESLKVAKDTAKEVGRGEGGREVSLVITKLEEAESFAERAKKLIDAK